MLEGSGKEPFVERRARRFHYLNSRQWMNDFSSSDSGDNEGGESTVFTGDSKSHVPQLGMADTDFDITSLPHTEESPSFIGTKVCFLFAKSLNEKGEYPRSLLGVEAAARCPCERWRGRLYS